MTFRDFTKNDWHAFAGAEHGDQGQEPQLSEDLRVQVSAEAGYLPATVVVDGTGVEVIALDSEPGTFITWQLDATPFAAALAIGLLLPAEVDAEQLDALGFERC